MRLLLDCGQAGTGTQHSTAAAPPLPTSASVRDVGGSSREAVRESLHQRYSRLPLLLGSRPLPCIRLARRLGRRSGGGGVRMLLAGAGEAAVRLLWEVLRGGSSKQARHAVRQRCTRALMPLKSCFY